MFHLLKSLLKKDAFAARRGRRDQGNETVQFLNVSLRDLLGAVSVAVRHNNGDNSTLSIYLDVGGRRQAFTRCSPIRDSVDLTQVKAVNNPILNGATPQHVRP